MGFTREQLETFRDRSVDDLIGPRLKLLFVGINPGLWTAATNTHFCHPSNRFYPALGVAGLIDWKIDPGIGLTDAQRTDLIEKGVGVTNLVNRATARADELDDEELRRGGNRLTELVEIRRPVVVAVAGITAYRSAFSRPRASTGEQIEDIAGSRLWVIPNPSGLNAHVTVDKLGDWMRRLAVAAGI